MTGKRLSLNYPLLNIPQPTSSVMNCAVFVHNGTGTCRDTFQSDCSIPPETSNLGLKRACTLSQAEIQKASASSAEEDYF